MFAALASSLAAMERALASQEATNRALRQSLDAHREVVERAAAAQERGARLVQAALDGVSASAKAQLDAARALVTPPGPRSEPFDPVREWNAMLQRMLEAVRPPARPGDQGSA